MLSRQAKALCKLTAHTARDIEKYLLIWLGRVGMVNMIVTLCKEVDGILSDLISFAVGVDIAFAFHYIFYYGYVGLHTPYEVRGVGIGHSRKGDMQRRYGIEDKGFEKLLQNCFPHFLN